MGLKFGDSKGGAQKSQINQYQYVNGDQSVRLVGDILPRYIYWVKGFNDKNIPFECLAFDRKAEAFTNEEKDWVREFYPDLKCGWSYAIKVLNLKKKLMEQIMTASEDLGDPTCPENGWSICFKKVKTGPMAYNVEYQLQVLKCQSSKGSLTAEEKDLVSAAKTIDEVLARPTADAQKALLDQIQKKVEEEGGADPSDPGVETEFDIAE
jgi:hypothetical protein